MKKCIFLFISCFTIGFMSPTTSLCQTLTNGSFDGTQTGWTTSYTTPSGCTSNPEMGYKETNYGASSSTDYVAEIDNGSTGICQTISGTFSTAGGTSTTIYLDYQRRVSGSAPSTVGVIICLTEDVAPYRQTCTTSGASNPYTASNTTWGAYTTKAIPLTTPPTSTGKLVLSVTVDPYFYIVDGAAGTCPTVSCAPPPGCTAPKCSDTYGMILSYVGFTSPTPVTLVNFKTVKSDSAVDLDWQTATEINNDYFVVEKSRNGVDFTVVGIVDGAGNSQSTLNYQTTDHSLYNGISYYRLKQVDYDGKYSYSKIVAVNNEEMEIEIYPNPSLGSFKVNVINEKQPYSIEVTDAEGRLVYKSVESSDNSLTEINGLTKGVYVVHIIGENAVVNRKLVVL